MSSDLPQRFRDLAQQHQAVLEHWSVFWERVNARNRNHVPVWEAWRRFEKAFVDAALAVAELKAAVPPEVANLWIGPTGLVAVYCGYLRVGEALEAQAKFFQTWLPRVAGATDLHWIWNTDFHRYMERFEQDQWELRKAAEACEVWYRKQEVETIISRLQQPNIPEKGEKERVAETTRTEPASNPPEGRPLGPKKKAGRNWLIEALELLQGNPQLSDAQIAKLIGISRSTLTRNEQYRNASKLIRTGGYIPRGYKPAPDALDAVARDEDED